MNHASTALYPAIKAALDELGKVQPGFSEPVDRAYNALHTAYWSETPAPESAGVLRPVAELAAN